jgi:hypothetical protein
VSKFKQATSLQSRRLVSATAEKMRDLILAKAPDALIGSLPELAQLLGVGIAILTQVAIELLVHVRNDSLLVVRKPHVSNGV